MSGKWNQRNPAVKRIVQELKEIQRDDDPDILAEAIEDNIFEWHFVIRGAWDTEFEGGIYHGRILMPAEYPFKPPAFVMLTPSGRFETGVKICLSISSHHPESWQPSWSVRSALVALIAFMQTPGNGALGSLDHPADVRRQMATESRLRAPAYGGPDRQALVADMHQRMLDLEERSRAVCKQERAADAGPAAATGAESPPATEQQQQQQQQPVQAQPAQAQPHEQEQGSIGAEEAPAAAPTPAPSAPAAATAAPPAPAAPLAAPPTPAEPELRQRFVPAAPSPPATQHVAAVPAGAHPHLSWEDRGLTYLAVLLALCIGALVVRKVVVAFSFSSDDLYTLNHVEGVEL